MSLERPNKRQLQLLRKVRLPDEEWAKDIIWLKRLDAVSSPKMQLEANKLYDKTIADAGLYSAETHEFKLISVSDNVWESQRQVKRNDA
jgi:hypothetical protein